MPDTQPRPMCYHCYRPKEACFCEEVIPLETFFEFRILMHPKEAKRSHVGTGRLANTALKNSAIIIGENFDHDSQVQNLLKSEEYFPLLLYPGNEAINISCEKIAPEIFQGRRPLLFILDGTWPCAKSMMRDSLSLHNMPRLSFETDRESKFTIRHQPAKYCLSTIESIHQVLCELEKQGLENLKGEQAILMRLLDKLVAFQKACALDPSRQRYVRQKNGGPKLRPYKAPSERSPSKKWERGRQICFEAGNYRSE